MSLDLCRFLLLNVVPSSLPFTKMLDLVLLHFGESIFVPVSKPCTCCVLSNRLWNKTGLNPPANCSSMDSQQSCCLRDREALVYQLMHHDDLYVKGKASRKAFYAYPGYTKSISVLIEIGRRIQRDSVRDEFWQTAAAHLLPTCLRVRPIMRLRHKLQLPPTYGLRLKEFLKSMERVRKAHAATPKKACKFLREEGVLTASGKLTNKYSQKKP